MIDRILTKKTGVWPNWITYWPIAIEKPRFATRPIQGDPVRLLIRCRIYAEYSVGAWLWWLWPQTWIHVPRNHAARAEATLKRYRYKLTERPITGTEE